MDLSIVTTLFNSGTFIEEFYQRITVTAEKLTNSFEVIIVNDGSPDNSAQIAIDLQKKDKRVTVIDLSRNFGHHKAIMTGLSYAKGEKVFLIDCDLEEEPELLQHFWAEYNTKVDVDVVYGIQENRKGSFSERVTGNLFYKLFNYFSSTKVPDNFVTARLMSREYVKALLHHREHELFLGGLWALTGFNQKPISIRKLSHSPTTYTLYKKLRLFVNSITSFSSKPLLYIFYLGVLILTISSVFVIHVLVDKLLFRVTVEGWTSLIISIWFLGGLILFAIGILGIYLSIVFVEVKRRPYTIVKRVYKKEDVD